MKEQCVNSRIWLLCALAVCTACAPRIRPVVSPDGPERIFVLTDPPAVRLVVDLETLPTLTPVLVRLWRQRIRTSGRQLYIVALPVLPMECRQLRILDIGEPVPDTVKFHMDRCPKTDEDFARVFDVEEVDDRPIRLRGPMPDPEFLLRSGIEGTVMMRFIVDTTGLPEPGSLEVVQATHSGFVPSARRAVLGSVFKPGRLLGRKVRTRVQMPIAYSLRQ